MAIHCFGTILRLIYLGSQVKTYLVRQIAFKSNFESCKVASNLTNIFLFTLWLPVTMRMYSELVRRNAIKKS